MVTDSQTISIKFWARACSDSPPLTFEEAHEHPPTRPVNAFFFFLIILLELASIEVLKLRKSYIAISLKFKIKFEHQLRQLNPILSPLPAEARSE